MNDKSNDSNILEPLYSPNDLAQYLGVSRSTAMRILGRDEIHHIKSGHHIWIPESAIKQWLKNQKTSPTNPEAEPSTINPKKGKAK